MTSEPGTLSLRKSDDRYYVDLDGEQAGWVLRTSDGTWSFYATLCDSLRGDLLAAGYSTRRDAIMEGLSTLRIHHLGRVVRLEAGTARDEFVWFDETVLRAVADRLLDEKYPS